MIGGGFVFWVLSKSGINIKGESYRLKEGKMHGLNSCVVNKILDVRG